MLQMPTCLLSACWYFVFSQLNILSHQQKAVILHSKSHRGGLYKVIHSKITDL